MKILIACEYSGIVREAFLSKGHDVISCDFLDTEIPGNHYKGDVRDLLGQKWAIIISHPSCQFMANSGVRWLYNHDKSKNSERWQELENAIEFFNIFVNHPCKKKCIENPIPHKYATKWIGKYTQTIQPYEFGHTTSKRTCLWLTGLPNLIATEIIPKEQRTQDIWLASPSPDRWKERSRTFVGIAKAMANQWG